MLFASVAISVVWACESRPSSTESNQVDYRVGTHVVLLGTGTPNAEPDRSGTAIAILVDGKAYLVDAGPGVVRSAAAGLRRGIAPLRLPDLDIVFVTHLHSDHTVGLPDLMFTPWVLGRDRPLRVYGPPGTTSLTDHLLQAYVEDIEVRTGGLEPTNDTGYRVEAFEIDSGPVYEDDHVAVTAFRVPHASWPHAFGYRFETANRTVVISGDAAPSEAIVTHCAGCDVLVHEVYSAASFARRAPVWQQYHAGAHTSTTELADIATRARPGLLVLYHQLLWGTSPEELVEEVREGWDGEVVFGIDLGVY
jgi:ribonuclease BN (tRNA processing enzyme)